MQFSIRRPKLPSSETHPEESLYQRLDVSAWLKHLNELGQVEEEYKLRKVRCTCGGLGAGGLDGWTDGRTEGGLGQPPAAPTSTGRLLGRPRPLCEVVDVPPR
jgi:hypothetical protein